MAQKVEESGPSRERQRGTTVSAKNQATIPASELRAAGLQSGDVVRVEGLGTALITGDDRSAKAAGEGLELRMLGG